MLIQRGSGKHTSSRKYLVSYLIVLAIPLTVLALVNYHFINGYFLDELVANKTFETKSKMQYFDLQLRQLETTVIELKKEKTFFSYFMKQDPTIFIAINEELRDRSSVGGISQDFLFYSSATDRVYSSDFAISIDEYAGSYERYSDFDAKSLRRLFLNDDLGTWTKANISRIRGIEEEKLLLIIPLEQKEGSTISSLIFRFDTDFLRSKVFASSPESPTIYFLAQNKNLLFSSIQGLSAIDLPWSDLAADGKSIPNNLSIRGEAYIPAIARSDRYGLVLIGAIPRASVTAALRSLVLALTASLLLIILLEIIIIRLFMHNFLAPLKKLVEAAGFFQGSDCEGKDEVEYALLAINDLKEQNKAIHELNISLAKDNILFKALRGYFPTLISLNESGKDAGVNFRGPAFSVVVILEPEYTETLEPILDRMVKDYLDGCDHYWVEYYDLDSVISLISGTTHSIKTLQNKLPYLAQEFTKSTGRKFAIGISGISESPISLNELYREASNRARTSLSSNTLYLEACSSEELSGHLVYPSAEIRALGETIVEAEVEKLDFLLSVLHRRLEYAPDSSFRVALAHDIAGTLIRSILGIQSSAEPDIEAIPNKILESGEQSFDRLLEILGTIESYVKQILGAERQEVTPRKNIDDIKACLIKEYAHPNFSIKLMADRFGMSISNLSHFYKKKVGVNISETVNDLRMEAACRLLKNTDLPLVELVDKIGYQQVSAFIKKFKRAYGYTPKEYREKHRGG